MFSIVDCSDNRDSFADVHAGIGIEDDRGVERSNALLLCESGQREHNERQEPWGKKHSRDSIGAGSVWIAKKVLTTATYIGLRTYRNKPLTTRWRVGSTGAGVPTPSRAKRAKESSKTGSPAARSEE